MCGSAARRACRAPDHKARRRSRDVVAASTCRRVAAARSILGAAAVMRTPRWEASQANPTARSLPRRFQRAHGPRWAFLAPRIRRGSRSRSSSPHPWRASRSSCRRADRRKPQPPHAAVAFVADDLNDCSPASAVQLIAPPFQPVAADNSTCFSAHLVRGYMFFWLNRAITRASSDPASIDVEEEAIAISDSHRSNAELATQIRDAGAPSPAQFASGLDQSTLQQIMALSWAAANDLADTAGAPYDPRGTILNRPVKFFFDSMQ